MVVLSLLANSHKEPKNINPKVNNYVDKSLLIVITIKIVDK